MICVMGSYGSEWRSDYSLDTWWKSSDGEHMDTELILRNNLKQARTEKNLSQSELARLALILCIALDKKFEELFYF